MPCGVLEVLCFFIVSGEAPPPDWVAETPDWEEQQKQREEAEAAQAPEEARDPFPDAGAEGVAVCLKVCLSRSFVVVNT